MFNTTCCRFDNSNTAERRSKTRIKIPVFVVIKLVKHQGTIYALLLIRIVFYLRCSSIQLPSAKSEHHHVGRRKFQSLEAAESLRRWNHKEDNPFRARSDNSHTGYTIGAFNRSFYLSWRPISKYCPQKCASQQQILKGAFCDICNLPIDASGSATTAFTRHESTIAHMVCLTHSHPPSDLDRSRQGLKYLSSYGWDPDSRQGLGATGEGIRAPIKAKVKNDTVGLGVKLKRNKKPPDAKVERLDAKQVRRKDMEDRRKRERLQEMFYRNDDVEKYLGDG